MKFYNTFKSWGGGYTTVEWSQDEMLNYNIVMLIIYCILLGIFSIIASPILILVTLHDIEDEGVKPSIWGAIISGLFILDMHYHLLLYAILGLMLGDHGLHLCTNLNIAYLVVHLFLILFSATVYYNVADETKRMGTLIVTTLVVFLLSFAITNAVMPYKEAPKKVETQDEKDIRNEMGNFKNEQERKEYFDRLERKWGNH
jgi:hypothetical protein